MSTKLKKAGPYILIGLVIFSLTGISPLADFEIVAINPVLPVIQGNTLLPVSSPLLPENNLVVIDQIPVIVTAYSSTVDQTDLDPFITASGSTVKEGIIATNILPFGTKVKIPKLYGDKIFIVEDRMHPRKGDHIDIWFPSRYEALNFGVKRTYIEILEG